MKDSFVKNLKVEYADVEELWLGLEWWRATVGDRFKSAGGKGLQNRITMFWQEGGTATRKTAEELREFSRAEHLEPGFMTSTVYNDKPLDSTLQVEVTAKFRSKPFIELSITGDVRQHVAGLEVLLTEDIEDDRQLQQARRERLQAGERKETEALRPADGNTNVGSPASSSNRSVVRWFWGTVGTVAVGLLIAYLTHAFGWNA